MGRMSKDEPIVYEQRAGNNYTGMVSGVDYSRSVKTKEQPASTQTVSSSVSGSSGGGGRKQNLDPKSEELMQFLVDIAKRTITDESIAKEKQELKERLNYSEQRALQAMYMSFAGDPQTASTIMQQTGEEIKTYKYLLGMIESDPEGYKQSKIANLIAPVAQSMQGAASIATAMYLPEAYDTQRYGYNASVSASRGGGGYSYQSNPNDMQDGPLVELIGLLLPGLKGKERKGVNNWILSKIGYPGSN